MLSKLRLIAIAAASVVALVACGKKEPPAAAHPHLHPHRCLLLLLLPPAPAGVAVSSVIARQGRRCGQEGHGGNRHLREGRHDLRVGRYDRIRFCHSGGQVDPTQRTARPCRSRKTPQRSARPVRRPVSSTSASRTGGRWAPIRWTSRWTASQRAPSRSRSNRRRRGRGTGRAFRPTPSEPSSMFFSGHRVRRRVLGIARPRLVVGRAQGARESHEATGRELEGRGERQRTVGPIQAIANVPHFAASITVPFGLNDTRRP